MAWFTKRFVLQDQFDDQGSSGGGGGSGSSSSSDFNMGSALSAISEGLGFGGKSDDGDGGNDGGDDSSVDGNGAVDGAGSGGGNSSATTTGEGDSTGSTSTGTGAEGGAASGTSTSEVPKTWRAEAAAEWGKLSPTVQAEILKREQDIFEGLEGYKGKAQYGDRFAAVFSPYDAIMKQAGADPVALTHEFMQAHMTFATGTQEQKVALLNRIIQEYGIQVEQSGNSREAAGDPPFTDPAVKALQDELKALKSQLTGTERKQAQIDADRAKEIRTKLSNEIEAFAKDPAHPYFDELSDDITGFIKLGLGLQQAYEKAVWANPATRAKEQARLASESDAKAKAEAAEKARKAREATAANVRTSAKNASGTAPLGSLDDTLKEAYARLHAKGT